MSQLLLRTRRSIWVPKCPIFPAPEEPEFSGPLGPGVPEQVLQGRRARLRALLPSGHPAEEDGRVASSEYRTSGLRPARGFPAWSWWEIPRSSPSKSELVGFLLAVFVVFFRREMPSWNPLHLCHAKQIVAEVSGRAQDLRSCVQVVKGGRLPLRFLLWKEDTSISRHLFQALKFPEIMRSPCKCHETSWFPMASPWFPSGAKWISPIASCSHKLQSPRSGRPKYPGAKRLCTAGIPWPSSAPEQNPPGPLLRGESLPLKVGPLRLFVCGD